MKRAPRGSWSRPPGPIAACSRSSSADRDCSCTGGRARAAGAQARRRQIAAASCWWWTRRTIRSSDRIRSEVVSLGLEFVVRAPQGPIEASARAEHAVAAIRILRPATGVEVWMADETSGRSLLRQVIVDETEGGPNQDVVALQTAELLRTGLFPKPPPAEASPAPAAPAPVIVSVAPPRSVGEKGVTAGVGLLYSAGGASPAWQASILARAPLGHPLRDGPRVSAPFRRGTMSRSRRYGRRRRDHRRCRGARTFHVRGRPPLPHHGARRRVRVAADGRTSEPAREQPAGEQPFRRVHRPRLCAGHPRLEGLDAGWGSG